MTFALGVAVFVLGLLVSIILHEIGHLVPAKRFGVRVSEFFAGFGPVLIARRRGETTYGIKAIPLGGYVRMVGMFAPARGTAATGQGTGIGTAAGPDAGAARGSSLVAEARQQSLAEIRPGEEHRAFYALSVPKKLVIMLGGPVMNLLIAIVLITVVLTAFGRPVLTTTLGNVQPCLSDAGDCEAADAPSPAALGGLEVGDRIVSWAGQSVASWPDIPEAIATHGARPATVRIERDGQPLTLTVVPELVDRPVASGGEVVTDAAGNPVTRPQPYVGIGPSAALQPQPLSEAPAVIGQAVGQTFHIVATLPQRLAAIANAAFGDGERDQGVVGIVGVGRFAGEIASIDSSAYGLKERTADMLNLLASLNLALFVFNLIPLLPLDGGHIAGALWEGLRRAWARLRGRADPGRVDVARALPLTYVVLLVMVGMSLLLAYADIVTPVSF